MNEPHLFGLRLTGGKSAISTVSWSAWIVRKCLPTLCHSRIVIALGPRYAIPQPKLDSREPEFAALTKETVPQLRQVFGTKSTSDDRQDQASD